MENKAEKFEIDIEFLNICINNFMRLIDTICLAKYGNGHNDSYKHIGFMRNLLINLIGNFIYEYSSQDIENALVANSDEMIRDLRICLDKLKTLDRKKGSH